MTFLALDEVAIVKALLMAGANPNLGVTGIGAGAGAGLLQSPLLLAVHYSAGSVSALLEAGADCSVRVTVVDKEEQGKLTTDASRDAAYKSASLMELARRRRSYDVLQALASYQACSDEDAKDYSNKVEL